MSLRRVIGRGSRSGASHASRLPLATALVSSIVVLCAAGRSAAEVRIVGAEEVRARYCREDGGRLYLVLPGLAPEELITSTADPAVANPGDGTFHPLDRDWSRLRSQASISRSTVWTPRCTSCRIRDGRVSSRRRPTAPFFLLRAPCPFRRRRFMPSSPMSSDTSSSTPSLPKGSPAWSAYLKLRGLAVDVLLRGPRSRRAAARDLRRGLPRPGASDLARGDGSVENASHGPADDDRRPGRVHRRPAGPRPSHRAHRRLRGRPLRGGVPEPVPPRRDDRGGARAGHRRAARERTFQIVDARGRVVRRESVPASSDGSATWRWDGRGEGGVELASGTYFVHTAGESGRATRIVFHR